ncbi:hypothetical protein FACS189481_1900 [Clostridia bacterium]|nr:hypothetical protein FACS189481_1900 [Clostridia bacterium]
MEDICVSLIESDFLFLIPILFSVFRSLKVLKKEGGSKVTFFAWYILCFVLCLFYKFSGNPSLLLENTFFLVFESLSQGLLIGSLVLNLKDVKNIFKTVLKKGRKDKYGGQHFDSGRSCEIGHKSTPGRDSLKKVDSNPRNGEHK